MSSVAMNCTDRALRCTQNRVGHFLVRVPRGVRSFRVLVYISVQLNCLSPMQIVAENRIGRRILRHIRALAHPRFVGTAGELRAQNYIRAVLRNEMYHVMDHPFTSSFFPLDVLPRIIIASVIIVLILGYFALDAAPAFSVESGVFVLLTLLLSTRWGRVTEWMYRFRKFGTLRSKNIVAIHPAQNSRMNIVFTAHYDSKSQTWSGPQRSAMFGALAILSVVSALALIGAAFLPIPGEIALVALVPAALVFLALGATATTNASPGAYDNASGVAVLLELAHSFAGEHPNANLVFIATGAAEAGLCGAVAMMQNESFREQFPPEETIVINLDGIGSRGPLRVTDRYGIPPVKTGPLLSNLAVEIAGRFGIEARRNWLPAGASLDHVPFAGHGYQAITLGTSGWNLAYRAVHTARDVADNLDLSSLEQCYAVCQEIVESIPYIERPVD